MRILMVSDFYPPVIGGLEKHVEGLAKGLVAEGHEVEVVTVGQPLPDDLCGDVKVHRCPPLGANLPFLYQDPSRPYHPPAPVPSLVKEIRLLHSVRPFDIVHAHGWSMFSAAKAIQQDSSTRLVATVHDYGIVCPRRTLYHRDQRICQTPGEGCWSCTLPYYGIKSPLVVLALKGSRRLLSRVDRFIAVSSYVARILEGDVGRGKTSTIPNFLSSAPAVSAARPKRRDRPFFLYLGALSTEKGVHFLLDAWSESPIPGHDLVIMGRPLPHTSLKKVPHAYVIESASQQDVAAALRETVAVVMPALWPDPCPTVAFEAMALHRPIVASRVGGLDDIIVDGVTGITFAPGSKAELRSALLRVTANPAEADSLGRAAADRYKTHYTATVVIRQITAIYAQEVQA